MRKINKPVVKIQKVIEDCISNLSDISLKTELEKSYFELQCFENDFDYKKQNNELYTIPTGETINTIINSDVLKSIYTERMLNKKNLGRQYYEEIFSSATNDKCPLCNQRLVATLDHYLPKSQYPKLSVSLLNLIPSCSDCNKGKLISYPTKSEEETIHPYYDDIEEHIWLKCNIENINPIIFNYSVSPPLYWSHLLISRVECHFNAFKLNKLYTTHAIEEFENIKYQLKTIFQNSGTNELKKHLKECFLSRFKINKNSWQTALYECLYRNDDFCSGKFI